MLAALLIHAFVDGYTSNSGIKLDLATVELTKEAAPVGFHLKMIAELAPELAPEILRRWPRLRDYVVRPARY